ncbi:MAG TPA: NTP transferase domain-containing protein, partial [Polyangia bacterium]|nr:NTP transferase domain-containing protein [Polyangia bacterium]
MITRALILAAGKGVKIGDHAGPNCLATVGRCTLLERTLQMLESVGVQKVGIVVGHEDVLLRKHVAASSVVRPAFKRQITYFDNPAFERPNGLSALAARAFVTERTLLVMADQIVAPGLVRELVAVPAAGDRTVLCVDRDLARVFDIDDATKVQLSGDAVVRIGKGLRAGAYKATSAGLFVMSPSLVEALEGLPEPSLTEGVQVAAARGLVVGHDVAGRPWQDVDTPEMKLHA